MSSAIHGGTEVGAGYCDGCGRELSAGDHASCLGRRAVTDPPRYCVVCARRLVVQVLPLGWTAYCVKCGPVEGGAVDGGAMERGPVDGGAVERGERA